MSADLILAFILKIVTFSDIHDFLYNTPMTEQPLRAGIIDFNPRRMTDQQATERNIPQELWRFVGDFRQYPTTTALHFPDGVAWLDDQQPWFFGEVMDNPQMVARLTASDTLILSGSGMSAHRYAAGESGLSPEDDQRLEKSQQVIRDVLGQGKWVLGICFGGQLALHAVGAQIGRLPTMANGEAVTEAGWLDHQLTAAGAKDAVFGELGAEGDTFFAPHLHNDFIATLPAIGTEVETSSGIIRVVDAQVLAVRRGYLGPEGLENTEHEYIQASVVVFDNGARIYQIQPHPEMAYEGKANFLVRQNAWVAGEMSDAYYQAALEVPEDPDYSVSKVITRFVTEAQRHLEDDHGRVFGDATAVTTLFQYLLD